MREEGQVAWLESPNGLDATAGFQLGGEVSRTKFPAILCRLALRSIAKSGRWSGTAALLIVEDHLRSGFVYVKLRAHLLNLRRLFFERRPE